MWASWRICSFARLQLCVVFHERSVKKWKKWNWPEIAHMQLPFTVDLQWPMHFAPFRKLIWGFLKSLVLVYDGAAATTTLLFQRRWLWKNVRDVSVLKTTNDGVFILCIRIGVMNLVYSKRAPVEVLDSKLRCEYWNPDSAHDECETNTTTDELPSEKLESS